MYRCLVYSTCYDGANCAMIVEALCGSHVAGQIFFLAKSKPLCAYTLWNKFKSTLLRNGCRTSALCSNTPVRSKCWIVLQTTVLVDQTILLAQLLNQVGKVLIKLLNNMLRPFESSQQSKEIYMSTQLSRF